MKEGKEKTESFLMSLYLEGQRVVFEEDNSNGFIDVTDTSLEAPNKKYFNIWEEFEPFLIEKSKELGEEYDKDYFIKYLERHNNKVLKVLV